jgi:hypothetical protein
MSESTPGDPSPSEPEQPVVTERQLEPQPLSARRAAYFTNMRRIFSLLFLGFGIYCIYDGFFKYPAQRAQYDALKARIEDEKINEDERAKLSQQLKDLGDRRSDFDILFNQAFGVALPPLAVLLYWRWMHISRGEYRLENDVLSVPGHPPVKLNDITGIDTELMKKKGILFVDYKTADGQEYTLKLDDFVYDQKPTDAIIDHIRAEMKSRVETA